MNLYGYIKISQYKYIYDIIHNENVKATIHEKRIIQGKYEIKKYYFHKKLCVSRNKIYICI